MTKFIFVTGGVVSGLGKGITAASLGRLLKQRGLKVAVQKLDPYMNIDPGTMSPFQHGEVFVTDDGAETDLDLGHYERFIDENLTKRSNLTSGKVYWEVLARERSGGYLGGTVQVIPHVTEAIKRFIYTDAADTDVYITEIGGTTGDIESQPFLEAIRQISLEKGLGNCLFIHVTLIPYLKGSGEHKSKPTQHSVKELRSMGISPNVIVARADEPISGSIKEKISLFCNVKPDCVIENVTLPSLYEAPLMLHQNGLDTVVCRELGIVAPAPDLTEWKAMAQKIRARKKELCIAIVGKYVQLHDAYLSIIESLHHAGFEMGANVCIKWVDSESITAGNAGDMLFGATGILIPGGFGDRGIDGMIAACRYARENDVPYLGICLGMQVAVIEFARHVCGITDAHSGEFDAHTPHRVIDIMPEQEGLQDTGGTMRLGAYPCQMKIGSVLYGLYGTRIASERHRHRFEFNNDYREALTRAGLIVSGESPDGRLVEAVELPEKHFFVGVQYHPEFLSRPNRPHPLFLGLVRAALDAKESAVRNYELEIQNRVAFIRGVLADAHADGIVYGNSGGKDSALVGILCKMACEDTVGIMMPCGSNRNYTEDIRDAECVARQYNIAVRVADLSDARNALSRAVSSVTEPTGTAIANIAPRLRMTALYTVAASENRLVAGTGNRSEGYMGYFTKWGDGAFDFNPIADLTVTEVYEFLRHLGAPEAIITKEPSAGLFDGQTDESEMGVAYNSIDSFLLTGQTSESDKATITRFHKASGHKRKMPLVFGGLAE